LKHLSLLATVRFAERRCQGLDAPFQQVLVDSLIAQGLEVLRVECALARTRRTNKEDDVLVVGLLETDVTVLPLFDKRKVAQIKVSRKIARCLSEEEL